MAVTDLMPTTTLLPAAEAATPYAVPAHTPAQPVAGQRLNDAELRAGAGGPIIRNESF